MERLFVHKGLKLRVLFLELSIPADFSIDVLFLLNIVLGQISSASEGISLVVISRKVRMTSIIPSSQSLGHR